MTLLDFTLTHNFGNGGSESVSLVCFTSPGGWWVRSGTEGSVKQQWRAAGGDPSLSSPALSAGCNHPEPSGTAQTPSGKRCRVRKTRTFTGERSKRVKIQWMWFWRKKYKSYWGALTSKLIIMTSVFPNYNITKKSHKCSASMRDLTHSTLREGRFIYLFYTLKWVLFYWS